jgi:hypothetical protein
MTTPEELIAMGASPGDIHSSHEELIARQERLRRRILGNADCGLEGDGAFKGQIIARAARIVVAAVPETE